MNASFAGQLPGVYRAVTSRNVPVHYESSTQSHVDGLFPCHSRRLYRLVARLEREYFAQGRASERGIRWLISVPGTERLFAGTGRELLEDVLLLLRQGASVASLYSLAICAQSPEHRGLLERCEARARERDGMRRRLEVRTENLGVIAQYQRCGYRRVSRAAGYEEDGSDAWRYEKTPGVAPLQGSRA
jgi:hypothetical protein